VFFARGISLGQKWWQTLLGRDISCSQWEGQSMHSRCLAFYPFKFWGERIFFFHFPLVPIVFPLNLQWVLRMGYPIEVANRIILFIFFLYQVLLHDTLCDELHSSGSPSSHCVTQHVLHSTSLLSNMLWQMLSSFHLYRWAKGEDFYTSKYNLLFWRASKISFNFSDGSIKLAHWNPKKSWTWKAHHLINRRG
jgi:hypothetical protein